MVDGSNDGICIGIGLLEHLCFKFAGLFNVTKSIPIIHPVTTCEIRSLEANTGVSEQQ